MKMQQYEEDGKVYKGCSSDSIVDTGDIAEEVFAEWDYGHAFAYLWRRFGPPCEGCDPYKELVGYFLTTRAKGVVLYVSPKTSPDISFGYMVTMQIRDKLWTEWTYVTWMRRKGKTYKTPRADRIKRALKDAMNELKRPTNVRDWMINIQGQCEDYAPRSVEPSHLAGYGITADYFDKFKDTAEGGD